MSSAAQAETHDPPPARLRSDETPSENPRWLEDDRVEGLRGVGMTIARRGGNIADSERSAIVFERAACSANPEHWHLLGDTVVARSESNGPRRVQEEATGKEGG